MKFEIVNYKPNLSSFENDVLYLVKDNWNDFGYVTMFHAWFLIDMELIELGTMNLTNINYDLSIDDYVPNIIDPNILNTPGQKQYISIGSINYYEELIKLGKEKRSFILTHLQDIVFNPSLFKQYENLHVVQTSLLRGIKAYDLENRYSRLANGIIESSYDINVIKKNSPTFNLPLKVKNTSKLPTNIHAIIGSNGSGKTQTIQHIAIACSGFTEQSIVPIKEKTYKEYTVQANFKSDTVINDATPLEGIIYISYSPFDQHEEVINNKQISFIGLEQSLDSSNVKEKMDKKLHELLTKEEVDENKKIIKNTILGSQQKIELWNQTINGLSFDKNIKNLLQQLLLDKTHLETGVSLETIESLSSGQKIILLSFASIINEAVERTLIIIDEPELFLHPPLITAYIRELAKILVQTNSLCLLATHSPFIIQELPSECVHLLSRDQSESFIKKPKVQTFGENIATINDVIFGTDMRMTGYFQLLTELYKTDPVITRTLISEGKLGMDAEAALRAIDLSGKEGSNSGSTTL